MLIVVQLSPHCVTRYRLHSCCGGDVSWVAEAAGVFGSWARYRHRQVGVRRVLLVYVGVRLSGYFSAWNLGVGYCLRFLCVPVVVS